MTRKPEMGVLRKTYWSIFYLSIHKWKLENTKLPIPSLKDSLVNVNSLSSEHKMIYNYGGFSGQGSLKSTANDLLLFDRAFFGYRLLSRHLSRRH